MDCKIYAISPIWAITCEHCQNTFAETAQGENGKGKKGIAQNAKAGLWPVQGLAALAQFVVCRYMVAMQHFEVRYEIRPLLSKEGRFPKIGKLQNPLIAYLEMVRRHHAEFNKSRLKASTALHLRCAGYHRKEVQEEMERHSPPPAHPDDLSPKIGYLQRILDYAFGAQGDIWVLGQRLNQTEVEKFNKEAEIIDYYMKHPPNEPLQTGIARPRHKLR